MNACRRLAALGGRESIAPLAALLADQELSHAARLGLEAIPDPAAGEALRTALPGLTGMPLVGAIQSLAARREAGAVADLGRYLADRDPASCRGGLRRAGDDCQSRSDRTLGERSVVDCRDSSHGMGACVFAWSELAA